MQTSVIIFYGVQIVVIFFILVRLGKIESDHAIILQGLKQQYKDIEKLKEKQKNLISMMDSNSLRINSDLDDHCKAINKLIERVNDIDDKTFMSIKNN